MLAISRGRLGWLPTCSYLPVRHPVFQSIYLVSRPSRGQALVRGGGEGDMRDYHAVCAEDQVNDDAACGGEQAESRRALQPMKNEVTFRHCTTAVVM